MISSQDSPKLKDMNTSNVIGDKFGKSPIRVSLLLLTNFAMLSLLSGGFRCLLILSYQSILSYHCMMSLVGDDLCSDYHHVRIDRHDDDTDDVDGGDGVCDEGVRHDDGGGRVHYLDSCVDHDDDDHHDGCIYHSCVWSAQVSLHFRSR